MTLSEIILIVLVLTLIISIIFAIKAFNILQHLTHIRNRLDVLAPKLNSHPAFRREQLDITKSITIVSDWIYDIRFVVILHHILITLSTYNIFYQYPINNLIGIILIIAHTYLISLHKSFRIKQSSTMGMYAATSNIIIAANLYDIFKEDHNNEKQ